MGGERAASHRGRWMSMGDELKEKSSGSVSVRCLIRLGKDRCSLIWSFDDNTSVQNRVLKGASSKKAQSFTSVDGGRD